MKSIQNTMRILFGVTVFVMIIIFFSVFSGDQFDMSGFMILPVLIIIVAFVSSFLSRKLSDLYRDAIVKVALAETFQNYQYFPDLGMEKERVYETDLFPRGNTYSSSDLVRVMLPGIEFEFADVSIEDVTHDDNGTHTTTYFKGKWVVMKARKPIESKLYIIDKDNRSSKPKGWIFKGRDLEKVEMESILFNQMFRVYASNPHDAFYILTPHVIEEIMNLDVHDLSVYQNADMTHVASQGSKPVVNVTIFSELNEDVERHRVKEQFQTILQFVDFFGQKSEGEA